MSQPQYPGSVTETPEIQLARSKAFAAHLRRLAMKEPDKVAFSYEGESLTFGELDRRASQLANALAARGIERGDRIAFVSLNHLEHVIAFFGAWRLGAVGVPMNFRLAPPELTYLIKDSGATAIVIDAPLDNLEDDAKANLKVHLRVGGDAANLPEGVEDFNEFVAGGSDEFRYVHADEAEMCLIMYTSGTTGLPKGAMLSYTNLIQQAVNVGLIFKIYAPDEVNLCGVPLFHIAGIGGLLPNFMVGGRSHIQQLGAFDPQATLELIRDQEVTQAFLVPTQWQAVCSMPPLDPPITTLRRISWGAAPTTKGILEAMDATFPGVENIAVFGQTEMSPVTCYLEAKDAIRKIGSVGKVIPLVEARIVDPEMNDVAPGEIGEIVYRGPTMMLGYWNRPEATADAFAGGWFHSGDLVRVDDEGFIYVVDRLKDMLISGGENIYCAEVEAAVQAHPDVLEAAVIGRPHEKWGEVPVVIVAPQPGKTLTEVEVLEFVQDKLARYKQPKAVHFVDVLPRNASGKVTKQDLRHDFSQPPA